MVGADGRLPLPWLGAPLQHALRTQRGHALLVHGPQGIGQFEMALTLAQAWLCEKRPDDPPCGACASCRLVQARSHPDLLVLLPEALRAALDWGDDDAGNTEAKASKVKPSKEIKVEAVRSAVAFAQTTSSRGLGKVVLVHPAERMNAIAANTLLKTLEEPPGEARFVLSCGAADALLPTIRSRCQALALGLPPEDAAVAWLASQQVAQPEVMWAAAGGQPLDALDAVREGIDAVSWVRLPKQLAAGDAAGLSAWPLPRLVDALQKLCHDTLCVSCGAAPRYFPPAALTGPAALPALNAWARQLASVARHDEHPWNLPLMAESLVQQARQALVSARPPAPRVQGRSIHSAR